MATRVGIMSMQRIFNYGSSLQAYGLKRLIETTVPHVDVRFVDYVPGRPLVAASGRRPPQTRLGRTVAKAREYGGIEASLADRLRFFNHKRRYAARIFPKMGIPPEPDNNLALDLQVIGSDEVFNCVQSNTNVGYSRDLFGHGSEANRLVTYAASFGNTTIEKIVQAGIVDDLRSDLSRFSCISVRDDNSARIVEELTGSVPTVNVDPVIAYDFMKREERIPTRRMHEQKYVIVYGYAGRFSEDENSSLRQFAGSRGLEVISLGGPQSCADRFIDCDPFELLAWFRDAEAVITDTFHGTILSMINHRPFVTVVRRSSGSGYGNEEKLTYLLKMFGLSSRAKTQLEDFGDLVDAPLDGPELDHIISCEREKSLSYLKCAIGRSEPQ